MEVLSHPYTVLFARLALGGIFLFSGIAKLVDRKGFVQEVGEYEILPRPVVRPFALVLPWVELALAPLLLVGLFIQAAALLGAGLLGLFSVAVGVSLLRGKQMDCHCFGQLAREPLSWHAVARNVSLVVLSCIVVNFDQGYATLEAFILGKHADALPPLIDVIAVLFITMAFLSMAILVNQAVRIQNGMVELIADYKEREKMAQERG